MRAYLKNYRQSPRKVRLVADMLRGKTAARALLLLDATPKRATLQLKKLLQSALSNAKREGMTDPNALVISEVRVDKGMTLKRFLPRAHGRASSIHKHGSNVVLILSVKEGATKPAEEKAAPKDKKAKKPAAKKSAAKSASKTKK